MSIRRDYYGDADFYADIDVRLHDYHNHSREFGHVDRAPEGVSIMKPELPYPEPSTLPIPGAPGPQLRKLAFADGMRIKPFPRGDEV